MLVNDRIRIREASRRQSYLVGKTGRGMPREIRYLKDVEGLGLGHGGLTKRLVTLDEARKEIQELFGTQTAFENTKAYASSRTRIRNR